jgi:hypothetical protein
MTDYPKGWHIGSADGISFWERQIGPIFLFITEGYETRLFLWSVSASATDVVRKGRCASLVESISAAEAAALDYADELEAQARTHGASQMTDNQKDCHGPSYDFFEIKKSDSLMCPPPKTGSGHELPFSEMFEIARQSILNVPTEAELHADLDRIAGLTCPLPKEVVADVESKIEHIEITGGNDDGPTIKVVP